MLNLNYILRAQQLPDSSTPVKFPNSKIGKLRRKRYKRDIRQPCSKLQMNSFVLPLTLFAVASLASDRNGEAVSSSNSSSISSSQCVISHAFSLGEAFGETIGAALGKLKEVWLENVFFTKKVPSVSLNELSGSLWGLKSRFDRELNHLLNMKLLFRELDRIVKLESILSFSELRHVLQSVRNCQSQWWWWMWPS